MCIHIYCVKRVDIYIVHMKWTRTLQQSLILKLYENTSEYTTGLHRTHSFKIVLWLECVLGW